MSNAKVIEGTKKAVLFSYSTPVVIYFKDTGVVWKTSKKHSKTTSVHVNRFIEKLRDLGAIDIGEASQEEIDQVCPISVTDL